MNAMMNFLYRLPAIVIAVTLHEYVKAMASARLGDPKPKKDGRLSLNPFVHMDILGTICLIIWGLGWGKPVETSPLYYSDRKNGTLIVYILPSVVNMIVGLLAGICLLFTMRSSLYAQTVPTAEISTIIKNVLNATAIINVTMSLFNFIPVYPLDGAKVLSVFLKPDAIVKMQQYQGILQIVLMIGIACGFFMRLIGPFVDIIFKFAR